MPSSDHVERFRAVARELESRPEVRILELQVNPPASRADIALVEERLGAPLAPAIRGFYEAADGLALRWIDTRSPRFDPARHVARRAPLTTRDVVDDDGRASGCVLFLPIRETFVDADWENQLWFPGASPGEPVALGSEQIPRAELDRSLRIFDYFHFFWMTAFLVRPGQGNPAVLLGSGHGASFANARVTDFESYVETVLAYRGAAYAREKVFGALFGIGQPPLVLGREHWEQLGPSLGEVLAETLDDVS